jgi:hypothetical protein
MARALVASSLNQNPYSCRSRRFKEKHERRLKGGHERSRRLKGVHERLNEMHGGHFPP